MLPLAEVSLGQVVINEVMASNSQTLADEDGDYEDWVELHNQGSESVNLDGWGLSDNPDVPFKWTLPNIAIAPGGYLLIWASGKGGLNPNGIPPADIPGLMLCLTAPGIDMDDPDEVREENGQSFVRRWKNPVNRSYDAIQDDPALQPVLIKDDAASSAFVRFDGKNDVIGVPGIVRDHLDGKGFTLMLVSRSSTPRFSILGNGDSGVGAVPRLYLERQGASYNSLQNLAMFHADDQLLIHSLRHDGIELLSGWVNGIPQGTIRVPVVDHFGGNGGLGIPGATGGIHSAGDVAAVILYNRALEDAEITAVHDYLYSHYIQNGYNLHSNFRISSAGENLTLTRPNGAREDQAPAYGIPTDISLGRSPQNPESWVYFDAPSPGGPNAAKHYRGITPSPIFSHKSGFHPQPFSLEISGQTADVAIHFTTDGSVPNETSRVYKTPISIPAAFESAISAIRTTTPYFFWREPEGESFRGTVIRAVALQEGMLPSAIISASFFVIPSGKPDYSLPLVSLTTSPSNFFDYEKGIYVPGKLYDELYDPGRPNWDQESNFYENRGWERPVYVEILSGGEPIIAQNAAVRVHGGASTQNAMKSLRLYAKGSLEMDRFSAQLFQDLPFSDYKRIILRNSGNDFDRTLLRDAFMQNLVRGLNLDLQAYEPMIMFLNGEYWGIHNLRERQDAYYLAQHYGIEDGEVTMMENNSAYDKGETLGTNHYRNMLSFITAAPALSEADYAHVRTLMDVENYIDYFIAKIFIGNSAWPHNNIRYWRKNTSSFDATAPKGLDGRWRWMVYDTDFGFGLAQDYAFDMMAWTTAETSPRIGSAWPNVLFRRLLKNQSFQQQFISRFADLLNTTFVPERAIALLDSMEARIAPEMEEHIRRWSQPASLDQWRQEVQLMRAFARQRPAQQRAHLQKHFGLSETIRVTVDVNDPRMGNIQVNSIIVGGDTPGVDDPAAPYPWVGIYFSEFPMQVEALPRPGYRFVAWQDGPGEDARLLFTPVSDFGLAAIFELDSSAVEHFSPEPFNLSEGPYRFDFWSGDAPAGTYPPNMRFFQVNDPDPSRDSDLSAAWTLPYNLQNRTRLSGLGEEGISFINTANPQAAEGAGYLGAAVLALNTLGQDHVQVQWRGGTIMPNSRTYGLRLQFRLGDSGPFFDVPDDKGLPVEYISHAAPGHQAVIGPVLLPKDLWNRPYIQLAWRYYHLAGESGPRPQLRLDDILVTSGFSWTSYAAWRNVMFNLDAHLVNSGIADPAADSMEDGTPNVLRYAFGVGLSDPLPGPFPEVTLQEGNLLLTMPPLQERNDLAYIIKTSSDLLEWERVFDSSDQPLDWQSSEPIRYAVALENSEDESSRFFRVQIALCKSGQIHDP